MTLFEDKKYWSFVHSRHLDDNNSANAPNTHDTYLTERDWIKGLNKSIICCSLDSLNTTLFAWQMSQGILLLLLLFTTLVVAKATTINPVPISPFSAVGGCKVNQVDVRPPSPKHFNSQRETHWANKGMACDFTQMGFLQYPADIAAGAVTGADYMNYLTSNLTIQVSNWIWTAALVIYIYNVWSNNNNNVIEREESTQTLGHQWTQRGRTIWVLAAMYPLCFGSSIPTRLTSMATPWLAKRPRVVIQPAWSLPSIAHRCPVCQRLPSLTTRCFPCTDECRSGKETMMVSFSKRLILILY